MFENDLGIIFRGFVMMALVVLMGITHGYAQVANDDEGITGNNLVINPGFENLDGKKPIGWGATGGGWTGGKISVSSEAARTGSVGIQLKSDASDSFFAVQTVAIESGRTYELSAWMKSNSGTRGMMKVEFPGNAPGSSNVSFDPADEWTQIKMRVVAPPESSQAHLLLRLHGSGEVYYDDVSFVLVDEDSNSDQQLGLEMYTFPMESTPSGFSLVGINYLENMPRDQLPITAHQRLETFATPGEYEPLSFVIYGHKDLDVVEVAVSDLRSKDGHIIPNSNIEIRMVKWMERRWRYSAAPTPANLVPDPFFLEVYKPFSLPANGFKQIWLTIQTPEGALAGEYCGQVIVHSDKQGSEILPIKFEVLPFALRESPKLLSVYYGQYSERSPEQRKIDFEDMRAHGIRHIVAIRPGIHYWDTSELEKRLREFQTYGFEGPYVVRSNFQSLPRSNEEIYRHFLVQTAEAVKDLEEKLGAEIVLEISDEALNDEAKSAGFERLARPAVDIDGLKIYLTMFPREEGVMRWIDPMVDVRNYHGAATDRWLAGWDGSTLREPRTFDDLANYINPDHDPLWLYYNAEEVEMDARWMRIINGVYFWQSPFDIHAIWTYSAPQGEDLFDDTEGPRGTMGMAFTDPRDGSLLSTRHWEAYREGGDDLKYLFTLEQIIEERKGHHPQVAEHAQAFLAQLKETWWPQTPLPDKRRGSYMGAIVRGLNAEQPLGSLQQARRDIADYIMALLAD